MLVVDQIREIYMCAYVRDRAKEKCSCQASKCKRQMVCSYFKTFLCVCVFASNLAITCY